MYRNKSGSVIPIKKDPMPPQEEAPAPPAPVPEPAPMPDPEPLPTPVPVPVPAVESVELKPPVVVPTPPEPVKPAPVPEVAPEVAPTPTPVPIPAPVQPPVPEVVQPPPAPVPIPEQPLTPVVATAVVAVVPIAAPVAAPVPPVATPGSVTVTLPPFVQEIKKFMPPSAMWTMIFALSAWGISTFVPPEYSVEAYGLWLAVTMIAKAVGVNKQVVYDVGTQFGAPATAITIADIGTSANQQESLDMETWKPRTVIKPSSNQHQLERFLVG